MSKKPTGADILVNEAEAALLAMMKEISVKRKATDDPNTAVTLTDKMKVIDRVIKLAAIKAKLKDDEYGAGFFSNDEDNDDKG